MTLCGFSSRWLILPAVVIPCLAQQSELFEAARLGDVAKLKSLVSNKSLVMARGIHYRTALHEAAANCQLEAAKLLVENGWDRQARDDQGKTPLMLASRCPGNVQAAFVGTLNVAMRVTEKDPWSLQHAAANRQTNVVAILAKMGADVNAPGSEGNRALNISCLKGDAATAKVLLENGANPNLRGEDGITPLHDAALSGNPEVIELLLAHGAEINSVDSESASTPLHYAASFNRLNAVKALVEHGADTNIRTKAGFTALQLAATNNFAEVAAFLRAIRTPR
jgi:ankyrin repeat protein